MSIAETAQKAQNVFFGLSNFPFYYRWAIKKEDGKIIVAVKLPDMRFHVRNEEINIIISHFVHNGFSVSLLSVEAVSYQLKIQK